MKIFRGAAAMARLNQLSQYSNAVLKPSEHVVSEIPDTEMQEYKTAYPLQTNNFAPNHRPSLKTSDQCLWMNAQVHHPAFKISNAFLSVLQA